MLLSIIDHPPRPTPLIKASAAQSCSRRSFSSSTAVFHSGWCSVSPSAP